MKIKFNVSPGKETAFKNIKRSDMFGHMVGRTFCYYIRTEATPCGNCVNLEDGRVVTLRANTPVVPLDGETNVWY